MSLFHCNGVVLEVNDEGLFVYVVYEVFLVMRGYRGKCNPRP
jgi:hypothetical protein